MANDDFKLIRTFNGIVLKKGDRSFSIFKNSDNDILFTTNEGDFRMNFDFHSSDWREWNVAVLFEDLFHCILGKYMLNKHVGGVDLSEVVSSDKKVITLYSDSGINSVLKIMSGETISVRIVKDSTKENDDINTFIIRGSGSKYEVYYGEFDELFVQLCEYGCGNVSNLKDCVVYEKKINNK